MIQSYSTSAGVGMGRVIHVPAPPVDWDLDDRMFALAERTASGSHCMAAQVGAVLVRDGHVLMARCNDAPEGIATCEEAGCLVIPATATAHEQSRHSHAEESAIVGCANQGIRTKGATLYISMAPCLTCARMICRAGIAEVVLRTAPESWAASVGAFLKQGGVAVRITEG